MAPGRLARDTRNAAARKQSHQRRLQPRLATKRPVAGGGLRVEEGFGGLGAGLPAHSPRTDRPPRGRIAARAEALLRGGHILIGPPSSATATCRRTTVLVIVRCYASRHR